MRVVKSSGVVEPATDKATAGAIQVLDIAALNPGI